jgi:alpha-methylacyl-CoA racemase
MDRGGREPQFYAILRERAGLNDPVFDAQMDQAHWPDLKARIVDAISARSQAEWCALFDGTDACVTPVMDMAEAPLHPHNVARGTFIELEGIVQPAPAPRFSATPGAIQGPPPLPGAHNDAVLRDWGFDAKRIERLRITGAI